MDQAVGIFLFNGLCLAPVFAIFLPLLLNPTAKTVFYKILPFWMLGILFAAKFLQRFAEFLSPLIVINITAILVVAFTSEVKNRSLRQRILGFLLISLIFAILSRQDLPPEIGILFLTNAITTVASVAVVLSFRNVGFHALLALLAIISIFFVAILAGLVTSGPQNEATDVILDVAANLSVAMIGAAIMFYSIERYLPIEHREGTAPSTLRKNLILLIVVGMMFICIAFPAFLTSGGVILAFVAINIFFAMYTTDSPDHMKDDFKRLGFMFLMGVVLLTDVAFNITSMESDWLKKYAMSIGIEFIVAVTVIALVYLHDPQLPRERLALVGLSIVGAYILLLLNYRGNSDLPSDIVLNITSGLFGTIFLFQALDIIGKKETSQSLPT